MLKLTLSLFLIFVLILVTVPNSFAEQSAEELFEIGVDYYFEFFDDSVQDSGYKAIEYFDKALEIDPEHLQALIHKAEILHGFDGNFEETMALFDKALEIDPTEPYALVNKGSVLANNGNLEESMALYETALEHNPDFFQAKLNIAIILYSQEKYSEAIPLLQEYLEETDENFDIAEMLLKNAQENRPVTQEEYKELEEKWDPTNLIPITLLIKVVVAYAETDNEEISNDDGGCLIATATYGTELAPQVQLLREIRDNTLFSTTSGTSFMSGFNTIYYSFAPTVADWERESPLFKETVKTLITPMLSTLSIMSLAEDGSEEQVLGLGISVIALNLGMYIAAPAMIGLQVRKIIKFQNY
ncbi:tetratricopeptide repeat protein [Nitrosopumilus cobalaminigenes]|nr:CFI-box-CTERM domain-containing protein [Nitrosopumilus cobalaminigenes]